MSGFTRELIVTTPQGRYFWSPALYSIDFVPKGKRRGQPVSFMPSDHWDDRELAIAKALYHSGIRVHRPKEGAT